MSFSSLTSAADAAVVPAFPPAHAADAAGVHETTEAPLQRALPTPPDKYDPPWKEVSGRFFPQLVEFFAHDVYEKIDWAAGYEFLERDPNPFALVVMAHLKTRATRNDAEERLRWKVELVRQLYGRGYGREDILELFRLIDWLLALPEDMERSFRQTVDRFEEDSKMKYVTSIERLSRKEGHEAGREEGRLEVILSQIEERFGPVDDSLRKTVEQASGEQILQWAKRLLSASSLDEVFAT